MEARKFSSDTKKNSVADITDKKEWTSSRQDEAKENSPTDSQEREHKSV